MASLLGYEEQNHIKFFKLEFAVNILKSPSKAQFSYIRLKKGRSTSLINERSFSIWVYNYPIVVIWIQIKLFQNFLWICKKVDFHLRRVKVLLRFLVLSLRYILKLSAKNWESGNKSSILVSDSRNISILLRIVCWKLESLFLSEFLLRWTMISFFDYVRRCMLNPIGSLFSASAFWKKRFIRVITV